MAIISQVEFLLWLKCYCSHEYYEDKLIELYENKKDLVSVIGGFINSIGGYDKSNKKGKYFKILLLIILSKS